MSLLREIQEAAVSDDVGITTLLRKAKVLAARVGSDELSSWVDLELNGYPDRALLPEYRIADVRALGTFAGPFGSGARNAPIPASCIPEGYRDWAQKAYLVLPISGYEELLKKKDAGSFQAPWPPDLIAHVAGDIYQNMNLVTAYAEVPRAAVVTVVDGVRNRLLNYALELEKIAPDAGEGDAQASPVSKEQMSQVFHNHIYGSVGTFAAGTGISISVGTQIVTGDFATLRAGLEEVGVDEQDINALQEAIQEDGPQQRGFGRKVADWVGGMIAKAAAGAWRVGLNTASTVLPTLLAKYYGIPAD